MSFSNRRPWLAVPTIAMALTFAVSAQQAPEKVDYDAIYKIKEEGFQRSKVMETASWLTDVHGPRLTGSPSFKAAADWAVKQLTEWGATNPHIESWGTFGRGWVNERFSATVVSGAQPWIVTGVPKAWTPGIDGTVTADVVYAPGLTDLGQITAVVEAAGVPVNVLALPSGPSIQELESAGVRRVSVGSLLTAAAYGALVAGARELLEQGTSTYAERRVPRDLVDRAFGA